MKPVSQNMSQSLRGQTGAGREAPPIKVSRPAGRLSMTVPGEGGVESAPGAVDPRSAYHFADAMNKVHGK